MQRRILVASALCFLLLGCGGASTEATSAKPENQPAQEPQSEIELLENIEFLLEAPSCDPESGAECKLVDVNFKPAKDWSSENIPRRRILLIDTGFASLASTGYRNRFLELYTPTKTMSLQQYRPSLKMPEKLDKVFKKIEDYGRFISVTKFKRFQTDKILKLTQQIPLKDVGHGYFIGAFLLEHNPEAQLVALEQRKENWLYSPAEACDQMLSVDKQQHMQALTLIRKRFTQYLQSIKEVVNVHQIDYINASWGTSRNTLTKIINRACGAIPDESLVSEILSVDHTFMQQLAKLNYSDSSGSKQDVVLVQAGAAGSSETLFEGHPDFIADCDSSITNRIRVSDFMYKGSDIPLYGSADNSILSDTNKKKWDCIDAFLPLGQYFDGNTSKIRDHSMRQIYHGFWEINAFPTLSSSSMAAPVVLSALNYHQSQSTVKLSPAELFSTFTEQNKITDPLQHQLFNVYHQGYRARSE